jgi:hypothetical protein
MQTITLGTLTVSRFILGSNPFSGFSHQGSQRDWEMRHYFSSAIIKGILKDAESLGVNTVIARSDYHVMRLLFEYRDEGGGVQWFAQTCPEVGSHAACIERAASFGAKAVHLHGGVMDYTLAQGRMDEIPPALDLIHQKGMLAGIAGHNFRVFEYAEEHQWDVDYYMCCHYNPTDRGSHPEHVAEAEEYYLEEHRQAMVKTIAQLTKPVVHYKIMAAGRNTPAEAFAFTTQHMRPSDMVCVGVFPKDKPGMLAEDVRLFEEALKL